MGLQQVLFPVVGLVVELVAGSTAWAVAAAMALQIPAAVVVVVRQTQPLLHLRPLKAGLVGVAKANTSRYLLIPLPLHIPTQ
jgi:hypothetical protein